MGMFIKPLQPIKVPSPKTVKAHKAALNSSFKEFLAYLMTFDTNENDLDSLRSLMTLELGSDEPRAYWVARIYMRYSRLRRDMEVAAIEAATGLQIAA